MSACGFQATSILTENGDIVSWGTGVPGVLGHDSRMHELVPRRLVCPKLCGQGFVQVCMAKNHTCAVAQDGELWTWGDGAAGRLGHGDQTCLLSPEKLGKERFDSQKVLMTACGVRHTLAQTADSRIWIWGWRRGGRLGLGKMEDNLLVPTLMPSALFGGAKIAMVTAGEAHTLALTEYGDIWVWGVGEHFRLGFGDDEDRFEPCLLSRRERFGDQHVIFVTAGWAHNMAITSGGVLFSWGLGADGQLGLGDRQNRITPTVVKGPWSGVVQAACGSEHSLVVSNEGALWSFGSAYHGELGHNDASRKHAVLNPKLNLAIPQTLVPTRVDVDGARIVLAMGGENHSAAVTEHGAVYSWGKAYFQYVPGLEEEPLNLDEFPIEARSVVWQFQKDQANMVLDPSLVAPHFFEGARAGLVRAFPPPHALAFAMLCHPRLGKACTFEGLLDDLIKRILETGRLWPLEGSSPGLLRLLGGGWVWGGDDLPASI